MSRLKKSRASKKAPENKTVPWWTEEVTILRKITDAARRRYQRTKHNDQLRE